MKLHKSLRLSTSIFLIGLWFLGTAEAGSKPCQDLVGSLHNQVNFVKDRGGMWSLYEKRPGLDKHSGLALKVDSKIIGLMFTLDYLCETQEGIPFNDIAEYVVSNVKKKGREGFIQENVQLGHPLKVVTEWADFADFSVSNLTRKLDIELIKKTAQQAQGPVDRYVDLYSGKHSDSELLAKSKALIADTEQLHKTDLYLKQADYENSQVPHSSVLANSGDDM
jgi:hypothetical protein